MRHFLRLGLAEHLTPQVPGGCLCRPGNTDCGGNGCYGNPINSQLSEGQLQWCSCRARGRSGTHPSSVQRGCRPPRQLLQICPFATMQGPTAVPAHHRLSLSPLTVSKHLPPDPIALLAPNTAKGDQQVADTEWKEQAPAPGQFSTQQETFRVRAKGMMQFKNQKPRQFSWKLTVLPPEGQEQGALLCPETLRRKQKSSAGRDKLQRDECWPPAQDTLVPAAALEPLGQGVAPGCHHQHLLMPRTRNDRAGGGADEDTWN